MGDACARCGGEAARAEFAVIAEALSAGDPDAAIEAGLLHWNGCDACASRAGLDADAIAMLTNARAARMTALAARDRFRARAQRLARRDAERTRKREAALAGKLSSLPPAAAAALARAKARATVHARVEPARGKPD